MNDFEIEKQVVEAKPRKLSGSWTLEKPEEWFLYSKRHSRQFLKSELNDYGLRRKWFGLESKSSMAKRLNKAFNDKVIKSITDEIDKEILESLKRY